MAVQREDPYGQYNFVVDLGDGEEAAFAEVSRLVSERAVAEYRDGSDKAGHVRKIPGLTRVTDVTLTRGITGSLRLFSWFGQSRDVPALPRTVTITLLDEARQPVLSWRLLGAFPVRIEAGPLSADANEVAIESLSLAAERLEVE